MHRFRKKSDAKRPSNLPSPPVHQSSPEPYESYCEPESGPESLPELPLASDFRTSLILTDLSRRFTLLSGTSTETASVDALKSRLADQRARGAEHQISEEEEDMIIETLGLRSTKETEYPSSVSASRSAMSLGSSNNSVSSKRYSNNLFGSGRLRDYSYIRSVSSTQGKTASLRTIDSSKTQTTSMDSLASIDASATGSASTLEALAVRSAPLIPPAPYGGQPLSVPEYRLSRGLGASALRRASLALEEAIKAIEEEAEDEIVMPRSTPVPRGSLDTQRQSLESRETEYVRTSGMYEAGMAISSDKHMSLEPDSPRASPIPSRILPGYIPGMPRPMTPRDTVDLDEQRSYSTTPRATSPSLPNSVSPSPMAPSNFSSGFGKNSSPPKQSPRSSSPNVTSPMFLQRTPNGRYTPEDPQRTDLNHAGETEATGNSSIVGRRRPVSPLSQTAYQPMAVSARPGTPSNVTWTTGTNGTSRQGHNRDASWVSEFSEQSAPRSLRSPALPDSPMMGPGHSTMNSFSSTFSGASSFESPRPMSSISGVDIGSPVINTNRTLRSPTPTQVGARSPTAGTVSNIDTSPKNGSRRSSKQNPPSTPFTLGPFQSLVFSPIANSSRSSLESAGSSYHSWDGDQKDQSAVLFADEEVQRPAWHEISAIGFPNSGSPNSSSDDWEAEDVVMKYAGLKKLDFLAMQEKLVGAAVAKNIPELQPRSPSLRRRRPSTSQSNYSLNGRIMSPPQSPVSSAPISDQYTALLNGVVDSLQSSGTHLSASVDPQLDNDASSTNRRNRDLAQVLFGAEGAVETKPAPLDLTLSVSGNADSSHVPNSAPLNSSFSGPYEVPPSSASATWPYSPSRNPSTPRLPQSEEEHAQLAKEVQRRTDAAMVMLQKQPSSSNLPLSPRAATPRKRISPSQISTPQLVSASTSVDTIPLPSPSMPGGQSKIGSRLKRLRGSLRAKTNVPTAEDVTPFPLELRSPPAVQTAHHDSAKFQVPSGPAAASATELDGFKVSLPSPPASAGPGLKGFMARFRGKQRASETGAEFDARRVQGRPLHHSPPSSETVFASPPSGWPSQQSPYQHSPSDSSPPTSQPLTPSASVTTPTQYSVAPATSLSPTAPLYTPRVHQSTQSVEATSPNETQAIRQLFDAASNLGLDQSALNDLLARSGSTSSRSTDWTMLTRNNSSAARQELQHERVQGGDVSRSVSHRSQLAPVMNAVEKPVQTAQPDHLRHPKDGLPEKSAIVRRTIIVPSETRSSTIDLTALMRKNSSRRRRASANSVSSRSVHDRVPTPPPSKPTGRRFSVDNATPPVPHLPQPGSSQTDHLLAPPTHTLGPTVQSNDSLYDMYSDKPVNSPASDPPQNGAMAEGGTAVEVIELANGETIWSIVNGLRDDDYADTYPNRASFASDYSVREAGDSVQVFFKEHGRKGSGSSFLPRKKAPPSKSRPETKVFYSSSAQIGRLIENMSQGMEAGSFNILPTPTTHSFGHSASSSMSETDMSWTVEERLEHMLSGLRR